MKTTMRRERIGRCPFHSGLPLFALDTLHVVTSLHPPDSSRLLMITSEHTSLATRAAPDSARDMLSVGAGASSGDAADQ